MTTVKQSINREYRLDPTLQRCCWYGIASMPVIAGVFCWVAIVIERRSGLEIAVVCALLALLTAALASAFWWRLRLYDDGLGRRWLFPEDAWRWPDLASGRIEKRHPHTLYDSARPWWRRRLNLGHLSEDDRGELLAVIHEHYRLPPPPPVPEALSIKYGFRRRATLDRQGMHVIHGSQLGEYLWSDLRRIHIVRMDQLRRDFTCLEIFLPGQEIELKFIEHEYGRAPTWRGATAEEINEFLYAHAPSDKIDVSIAGELPTKREDIERMLRAAEEKHRQLKYVTITITALYIGILLWDGNPFRAVVMVVLSAIFPGLFLLFLWRKCRREVDALRTALQS